MNNPNPEAQKLIVEARDAMRRGDKATAWRLAEQAAILAPEVEDVWLILTVSDPDPQYALAYAQKALEVNPSSKRARQAVDWALHQLKQTDTLSQTQESTPVEKPAQPLPKAGPVHEAPPPVKRSNNRKLMYVGAFLGLLICAVLAFSAYTALIHPAFASILNRVGAPARETLWAPVEVAKPPAGHAEADEVPQQAADTLTAEATQEPSAVAPTATPSLPTEAPTEESVESPEITETPEATETPASMVMEIVDDPPPSESNAPLPEVALSGNGTRWIDVDLTNQMVNAYEGDVVVNSFVVSTGTWMTPTVTGQYKVYVKYRSAKMSGPGYYLPNVPYIMYFYKGYGLHGTYWHNNFGTPMSHGCVNLRTDDAAWLYDWASVGTLVNVHH
jgi:lipoprotein-anchoring transpeptidase ErfK/SrfK